MLKDLVTKTRSYRRFKQDPVSEDTLRGLVELARLSPSGGNMQPLKFLLSCDPDTNAKVFASTNWAGYLKEWPGPAEGERPMAYVVILSDTEICADAGMDCGIAAQSIVLGAMEQGIGACMLGALRRDDLRTALGVPDRCKITLVVALGVPAETVVLEDIGADGSVKYYRDAQDVHHVPKRTLDELLPRF